MSSWVSKLPLKQRLVHRQTFEMPEVKQFVEELSVDGGKIRIRTPQKNPALGKNTRVRLRRRGYRGIFPRQRCPDRVESTTACLTNHLFRGWA